MVLEGIAQRRNGSYCLLFYGVIYFLCKVKHSEMMYMDRVILHCDLNNFYASVECLYNPDLKSVPMAVGGSKENRHGIILAKNNIAKAAGVKTAETIWQAKRKCPDLVIVPPRHSLYREISGRVREIYKKYTNQIEAFGIDENWLDVTGSTRLFGTGEEIAYEIKERIKNEIGITASVGVSFNKIFAKLGSDMKKPDAVTVISKENFKEKVWKLPVENLLYVGKVGASQLNKIGIYTIGELANTSADLLSKCFGKWGQEIWIYANGLDDSPVAFMDDEEPLKSISNSITTAKDLSNNYEVKLILYQLAESVGYRLRKHGLKGKTIQITIKDSKFKTIDRQITLSEYTDVTADIAKYAYELFLKSWDWNKNIRLLGIRVTNFLRDDECEQITFFNDEHREKQQKLDQCLDKIRDKYGQKSVQRALLINDKN